AAGAGRGIAGRDGGRHLWLGPALLPRGRAGRPGSGRAAHPGTRVRGAGGGGWGRRLAAGRHAGRRGARSLVRTVRVVSRRAAEVIVTEPVPHRREAALRLGAAAALDPAAGPVGAAIREMTGGRGVDVAFEAAGAPQTPSEAAQAVRPGGHVVLVGIPADDHL